MSETRREIEERLFDFVAEARAAKKRTLTAAEFGKADSTAKYWGDIERAVKAPTAEEAVEAVVGLSFRIAGDQAEAALNGEIDRQPKEPAVDRQAILDAMMGRRRFD